MSRGYNATPVWGLSRKSAVARHFFVKIFRLHIVRISALHWTEFHQNRKDPIREIQRFPNLGHNLCENDKQTLPRYDNFGTVRQAIVWYIEV